MKQKKIDQILFFENNNPHDCLYLFDIDSTLYNVSPRTEIIVKEFCKQTQYIKIDPEAVQLLENIKISSKDWGFSEALIREDFSSKFKLIKYLTEFWREYFFWNEYIKFDQLYPFAQKYVQKISQLNFPVHYLTGRSEKLMFEGTINKFKEDKLILLENKDLIMKTNNEPDHIYKIKAIEQLKKKYKKIIFFENEPLIINALLERYNDVDVVFINSTHSRKAQLKFDIPTIPMNYEYLI